MPMLTCPSERALSDFALGRDSIEDPEEIAAHAETCDQCARMLETLDGQPDDFQTMLRSGRKPQPFVDEPSCRRVVESLQLKTRGANGSLQEAKPPETIREYRLGRLIGRGGMGSVHYSVHATMGRAAAIKLLAPERTADPQMVGRFEKEIQAIARLDHPNVVRAYDAGRQDGVQFLVLEYVDGTDLSSLFGRVGTLSFADAAEAIRQAALGLQSAHDKGLIHRDIKPSNLLLSSDGVVKIADFGLALLGQHVPNPSDPAERTQLTQAGQIMGTVDYMAPEQIQDSHQVDARTDLYSLGCTFFRLLTGVAPFSGSQYATYFDKTTGHVRDLPPSLDALRADAPAGLVEIIARLLRKKPDERIQTARELAAALAPFAAGADLAALARRAAEGPAAGATARPADQPRTGVSSAADTSARLASGAAGPLTSPAARDLRTLVPGTASVGSIGSIAATETQDLPAAAAASGVASVTAAPITPVVLTATSSPPSGIRLNPRIAVGAAAAALIFVAGLWVIVKDRNGREVGRIPVPENGSVALETQDGAAPPRGKGDKPADLKPSVAPAAAPKARARLAPEPLPERGPNESLSRLALVGRPATLPGVRSWTVETKQHRGPIRALAVSPDNTRVATGGVDGAVRIHDLQSGRLERILFAPDSVGALSWSADSVLLAVSAGDPDHVPMQIRDVATGRVVRSIPRATLAAWSPANDLLAVKDADGPLLRLLDADGVREIRRWELPFTIDDVAFSPDGKSLAVAFHASQSEAAALIDVSGRTPPAMTDKAGTPIDRIAWAPDGRSVAGTGQFGGLFVWDAKSRELRTRMGKVDPAATESRLAWLSNDQILFLRNHALSQWSVEKGARVTAWEASDANNLAVSSDGRSILLGHRAEGKLTCSESDAPKLRWSKRGHATRVSGPGGAVWSPRGDRLAIIAGGTDQESPRSRFFVIDAATGTSIADRRFHADPLTWDASGERLLGRSDDHYQIVALGPDFSQDPKPFATSETPLGHQFALSQDGVWFAAALDKGGVGVWKVGQEKPVRVYAGDGAVNGPINWSPDSKFLAVNRHPGYTVHIYDPTRDGAVHVVARDDKQVAFHPAWAGWSRDGRTLAIGSVHLGLVSFWDASRWTMDAVVRDLPHSYALQWIPEGVSPRIALFGQDRICRIYSADLSELERTTPGYVPDGLSPDGRLMASPEDTAICIWEPLTGRRYGTWVPLENDRHFVVAAEGHLRTSHAAVDAALCYVVETDAGQTLLTPAEFAKTFNWKNDPTRVRLAPEPEDAR